MSSLPDAIADGFAEADELAEDKLAHVAQRFYQLLENPKQRNPEIWAAAGANVELTAQQLEAVPPVQRDDEWTLLMGRMFAAAKEQAYIEVMARPLMEAAHKASKSKQKAAKALTRAELKTAAVEGVSKAKFDEAKQRRRDAKKKPTDI